MEMWNDNLDTELQKERLLQNIEIDENTGCWIWTGRLNRGGYGIIYPHKLRLAHRLSQFLYNGEFGSLQINHKCDNPPCVNPDHLYAGTSKQNSDDRWRRERRENGPLKVDLLPKKERKKRKLSLLTRAIKSLGLSPKEFSEHKLGLKLPTFQYRCANGVLRLEDYQRIMFYTGRQFHELWPSEWDQKSQRIPINLNGHIASPHIPDTNKVPRPVISRSVHYSPPTTTTIIAPRLTPTPQENKKKEETFSAPPAPVVYVNPYDEGLPPID
jgi:hypothetical protein